MPLDSPRFYLYKRPNQIYYVGYYDNGRLRWKSTGARTKPEAQKALTGFREWIEEPRRRITLEEFVERFLSYSGTNHSHHTFRLFRAILERFEAMFKGILLDDVTAEHIDRFKVKRLRVVKPVSVNVDLRMLKSAFNTARRWKLIASNPLQDVSLVKVAEQAPHFFTVQDFQKLVEVIRETWLRDVVLFAVLTGMRKGEILNLRWSDVDMTRRVVDIQSSPTFKTKQGRRRTIPLNDTALYLLHARRGKSPSEFVFSLNDKPIDSSWLTHLFKRYVRSAKLADERLHFHSIRHTFASWLVQGGATLYEVQKLLGHSSSKVTEVYSHLQPSQLHDTVNKIPMSMN